MLNEKDPGFPSSGPSSKIDGQWASPCEGEKTCEGNLKDALWVNGNGAQQTFGIKEVIFLENGVSIEAWRKSQN